MKSSVIGSFLLILLVAACTTSEKVDQTSEIESSIAAENGDKFHKKRSITNIMKLLLGGNVPPNHPLVKESEPKSWNLAPQILASLPGSGYGLGSGWGPTPAQKLQQIFETKAKILPYTGQVASGLIGIGGVKGEILKQIHGLSTAVIANAAAEAAQKAVRTALAAQAVTNQVVHATPHILNAAGHAIHSAKAAKAELVRPLIPHANGYANFGVGLGHHHHGHGDLHQGWHSTQQNSFALPNSGAADKTPGDLPGPPYPSQSAQQTQLYQAPAYQSSYPAAAAPSASSPDYGQAAMYNMQQNGQQQESASEPQQTQDYNELVNQITNDARNRLNAIDYSTLAQQLQQQQQQRPGQNYGPKPQVQFRTSLGGNIQEMFRKLHPFFRASPKSPRPAYPHISHSAPSQTFPPPPQQENPPQQPQVTPLYPDQPQLQASQLSINQAPTNWGDSQVAPITSNLNQFGTTKPKVPISTLQALLAVPNMSPTMLQSILLKLSETHQMPTDYMTRRSSSDPAQTYYDDQQQQYSQDSMTGSEPALDLLVDSILSQPDHMLTKRHALLEPEEQLTLTPVRRQETLLVHPEPILVPSPKLPLSQLVDRLRTFLVRRPTSHRLQQVDSDTPHKEINHQPTVLVGTEVLI